MQSFNTDIIRQGSIQEVILKRDRAIELYYRAMALMAEAAEVAKDASQSRYASIRFDNTDFTGKQDYDKEKVRQSIDRDVWLYLLGLSGLKNLMDAEAYGEFRDQLEKDPPEVTLDTLTATFRDLGAQGDELFRRGLVNVFKRLNYRAYKTNDAFSIGKKIIVEHVMGAYGGFSHWGHKREAISDLDRIFHILDGQEPVDHRGDAAGLVAEASHRKEYELETEYFRFRWFKNGNMHIWLLRPDLVTKANKLIAEHFGPTLRQAS